MFQSEIVGPWRVKGDRSPSPLIGYAPGIDFAVIPSYIEPPCPASILKNIY